MPEIPPEAVERTTEEEKWLSANELMAPPRAYHSYKVPNQPRLTRYAPVVGDWVKLTKWLERGGSAVRVSDGLPLGASGVYVIAAVGGCAIKIGHASDFRQRIGSNQVGCPHPLRVVALIDAGSRISPAALEAKMHKALAKHRMRGEWFADIAEVRAYAEREWKKRGGIWVVS